MPRLASSLKVDLVSTGSYLAFCWVIDSHDIICLLSEFVCTHNFRARCCVGISSTCSSDPIRPSWLPGLLLRGGNDCRRGLTSSHACHRFQMPADHLRGRRPRKPEDKRELQHV